MSDFLRYQLESLKFMWNPPPPPLSSLVLHLEPLNVLGGSRKPYVKSLKSWSYLPPTPIPMGQTGVIK